MDDISNSGSTPSLTTSIVEWLTQEIEQQRLQPGNKLPSEKQLGEQFSVSRSVVREALSQLKSDRLISSQQGRGVFVNERGTRQTFRLDRSEEHTSELQSLVRISYTDFCLKKKKTTTTRRHNIST